MKRLVLLGEGHGEVLALPILIRKLLQERDRPNLFQLDYDVVRFPGSKLVRWNKDGQQPDFTDWIRGITIAARRRAAAVLAVYDGDFKRFPPGSSNLFCAATAAKLLAAAATEAGAGRQFSLAVVFACVEYETWIVAGCEALRGQHLKDGRLALSLEVLEPSGDPESHGKRWLERHCPGYRGPRDQAAYTELLDLSCVRKKGLRSFRRFEHALDQLLEAAMGNFHLVSPA